MPQPPLTVRVVRIRYPHWGGHSGFSRLAASFDPARVRIADRPVRLQPDEPRRLDRLSKVFAERMAGGRCVAWYNTFDLLSDIRSFTRALAGNVDVLHYFDGEHSLGFLPARLKGSSLVRRPPRVIATFHQPAEWLPDIVREEHLEGVDLVTVVARDQARYFREAAPSAKVAYLPHGVDAGYFRPGREERGEGRFRCVTVGSWLRDHGTVLRLAGRFGDVDFHLVSPGATLDRKPNLFLHDRVGDRDLRRLYREAHVLLLPLVNGTANNALLEGMACGLPVITTDLPGTRDYAPGEEAMRIAPGDLDGFAGAIESLREDEGDRRRRSAAARGRAESFDWKRIAPLYESAYRGGASAEGGEP